MEAGGGGGGQRRTYCCRKCGQPKKGHTCTAPVGVVESTTQGRRTAASTTRRRDPRNEATDGHGRRTHVIGDEEDRDEVDVDVGERRAGPSHGLPDYFVVLDLEATCDENWNRDFTPQVNIFSI